MQTEAEFSFSMVVTDSVVGRTGEGLGDKMTPNHASKTLAVFWQRVCGFYPKLLTLYMLRPFLEYF